MPKNPNIKKVLVLGSGPIVIGQAAEFDYAGTQACRALKEYRAAEPGQRGTGHRHGAARLHPAHLGGPDRAEPGHEPPRAGHTGQVRRAASGHQPRVHPQGGGPPGLQGRHGGHRPALRHQRRGGERGGRGGLRRAHRLSGHCPPGLHPGRHRRRHRLRRALPPGDRRPGHPPLPCGPGAHRAVHLRLEGDRVRGHAGLGGQCHPDLLHGERGPGGRPHRRLHRGGPHPDPGQPGVPDAPQGLAGHHLRPGDRGRVQRAAGPEPRLLRVRGHRGQPPGVPLLRPGLQGHGLPHRQGGGQDRPGLHPGRDPQRGDRQDHRLLRAHPGLLRIKDPPPAL